MTLVKAQAEVSEFRKRFRWMAVFVVLFFVILAGRLFQLQILDGGRYFRLSQENIIRNLEQPSVRGTIRDARGRELATNRPSLNVYVTPHFFDPDDLPRFASFLGLDETETTTLRERLAGFALDDLRRFQPFLAREDMDREALALVETHLNELGGVRVQSRPVRTYPFSDIAAHILGYVNQITAEDLTRWEGRGYRQGDIVGRTGIERAFEEDLRGSRGWRRLVVDSRGLARPEEDQEAVLGDRRTQAPDPGHDLTLTLDIDLQRIVDRALRGHPSGAAVVVEVRTGRVLAIVSKPSFDPNAMTGGLSTEQMAELTNNPLNPLFNRALMGNYSPGSTFKIITALAALEEGVVTPTEQLFCGGFHELGRRAFRCSHVHREVDLRAAIVQSCNVFFYRLAERRGMMDSIARYARTFGFGQPTGIGMSEASGRVDTREQHEEYRLGHALNAAIGQGRTLVTVLQLAMAYAAVANGGTLYEPQVVRRVESADGSVVHEYSPRILQQLGFAPENLQVIVEAMIGVVHSPLGTAHVVDVGGLEIAGKTGTAEVPRRRATTTPVPSRLGSWFFNRDHAWFAGFAPARDPEIAVAVLIEHGGTGGRSAAPVAMRIFRDYFETAAATTRDRPVGSDE